MRSSGALRVFQNVDAVVGGGQIECPKKGTMAIARCHEWQRDTAAAGASCTCPVFLRHQQKAESHCGRQIEPDQVDQVALDDDDNEQEEVPMPRTAQRCSRCNQFSPENTHLANGLCAPCRKADRDKGAQDRTTKIRERLLHQAATKSEAAKPAEAKTTIEKIVEKHVPPSERTVKQPFLPTMAEQEIERLRDEMAAKDALIVSLRTKLGKVAWLADGIVKGFTTLQELGALARELVS